MSAGAGTCCDDVDAWDRILLRVHRTPARARPGARVQLGDDRALRTSTAGPAAVSLGHGTDGASVADRPRGHRLPILRYVPARLLHGPGLAEGLGAPGDARPRDPASACKRRALGAPAGRGQAPKRTRTRHDDPPRLSELARAFRRPHLDDDRRAARPDPRAPAALGSRARSDRGEARRV